MWSRHEIKSDRSFITIEKEKSIRAHIHNPHRQTKTSVHACTTQQCAQPIHYAVTDGRSYCTFTSVTLLSLPGTRGTVTYSTPSFTSAAIPSTRASSGSSRLAW